MLANPLAHEAARLLAPETVTGPVAGVVPPGLFMLGFDSQGISGILRRWSSVQATEAPAPCIGRTSGETRHAER